MKKKVGYTSPEINLLNFNTDIILASEKQDGVYLSYGANENLWG